MASSKNALQMAPTWLFGATIPKKEPLYTEAVSCTQKIKQLVFSEQFDSQKLNKLVAAHKEALEVMKFYILERFGITAFILIQGALDHYYRNVNAEHVKHHVFFPLFTLPHFGIIRTDAQERYLREWERSAFKKIRDEFDDMFNGNYRDLHFQVERGMTTSDSSKKG